MLYLQEANVSFHDILTERNVNYHDIPVALNMNYMVHLLNRM